MYWWRGLYAFFGASIRNENWYRSHQRCDEPERNFRLGIGLNGWLRCRELREMPKAKVEENKKCYIESAEVERTLCRDQGWDRDRVKNTVRRRRWNRKDFKENFGWLSGSAEKG